MGKKRAARLFAGLVGALILSACAAGYLAYRSLVTELAVSTATDVITQSASAIVKELMAERGADFVTLQTDADGAVTAVTTNVAAVNALAAEALARAVDATADNDLAITVPVGNVLGVPVFSVPARVKMLSSSRADFRSELTGAGINQTRHRVVLELSVDASLFMPWRIVSASAETEILISETVIVGDVPRSYWSWENE